MTPRLDEAFARAAALPEEEQEELGQLILEMIESDERWDRAFAAGLRERETIYWFWIGTHAD